MRRHHLLVQEWMLSSFGREYAPSPRRQGESAYMLKYKHVSGNKALFAKLVHNEKYGIMRNSTWLVPSVALIPASKKSCSKASKALLKIPVMGEGPFKMSLRQAPGLERPRRQRR